MSVEESLAPIPVTCVTGFLGAGKTTTILGLLKQLPKDYKVVLLKNEYGDVEVDSLLAQQGNITGVSEILNGCLCCTMVGLVENALLEIKDKYRPDRIIIESSGSAFPATLALQIRQLEPQGFKLDAVVTVIDCVNFRGYEDSSPSAKLQAKYTDLLLLSKHQSLSENQFDILLDHLGTLNEDTPRIKIGPDHPASPEVVFGLDTKLFGLNDGSAEGEKVDWEKLAGKGAGWHGDEIEVRGVWRGGKRLGGSHGDGHGHQHSHGHDQETNGVGTEHREKRHKHEDKLVRNHVEGEVHQDGKGHQYAPDEGASTSSTNEDEGDSDAGEVVPLEREVLEKELDKLNFEIYRVKGIIRLSASSSSTSADSSKAYTTYILNYAFGRYDLIPYPTLDDDEGLKGVSFRLTIMGERGEVAMRAERFAQGIGGQVG